MMSGVSLLSRKAWATWPANPTRIGYLRSAGRPARSHRLAPARRRRGPPGSSTTRSPGLDAGADLDRVAVAGARGHPAQAGPAVGDDEDAREAAALEDRRGRNA